MASEQYDEEEIVDEVEAGEADDERDESRRKFEEKARRQLRRGRLTVLAEKLSGGPERPGEQRVGRSPVVLLLMGSTIGATILAAIFWFINATNKEERLLKEATTSLEQKKYLDAEGQFERFIGLYPKTESTGIAKIGLHRAHVEKFIETEIPDVAKGYEELEKFISECRDLPQFAEQKDYLRKYAERLTFAGAYIAEKAQSNEALEISRKSMDLLKKYAGDEGINPELEQKLINQQRLGEAAVAKKEDYLSTLSTVRTQLQDGRVLDAIRTREDLLIRYPLLASDQDVQKIEQEILAKEVSLSVATDVSRDAMTEDVNSDVLPSVSLALRTQATTDLTSQKRIVYAMGLDSCFAVDADTGSPVWRRTIGSDPPFPPMDIDNIGVLVFSTLSNETQMLSHGDGRLLWRQSLDGIPLGMPIQIADNIYFTTQSGELWQIAAATGRAGSRLKFSQSVVGPPALSESSESGDQKVLVMPGDQTLIYTIGMNPLRCLAVSHIPHATGSVRAPIISAGRYFLLSDNFTAEQARIRTLEINPQTYQLSVINEQTIGGQVNDPMLIRGAALFVPSTPQQVTAFHVTDEKGEPSLSKIGANQLEEGIQTRMFLLAGPGGQLWLGGRDLRKFDAQIDSVVLDSAVTAEGIHTQPIQFLEQSVFLTTRNPTSNSIFLTRADREQMKGEWRTVLGSKLAAVAPSATADSLIAIADYGDSYRIPLAEIGQHRFVMESVSRFRLPDKLSSAVEGLVLNDGRTAAWCGAPEPSMWTFTLTGQLERKWTLPDAPQTTPVAIDGGVVFALPNGQLHLSATAGGKAAGDYRSSSVQDQQQPWKSLTAISKTQVLAITGDNQFVRVEFRSTPRPQLSEVSVTEIPHPVELPPAVSGAYLYVATADGKLLVMQTSNLEVISEVELGGIPSAMPKVTDELVIVEVAGQKAKIFRGKDQLEPTGEIPLQGYGLVGMPLRTGAGYLQARLDGQVISLTNEGVPTEEVIRIGQQLQFGPISVGGRIIVVGLDGSVYQLNSAP
ncbi:MAG: PQQ-binding-like beta-propeller repeat protein [Planctomycetota bacterium]